MGGKGSGRIKETVRAARLTMETRKRATQETLDFNERLITQAGDRMFSVERKYPNGNWFVVGSVENAKEETLGETFGGGSYRLYEVDKGSELRTNKPPLSIRISPAKWPAKPEYAKDPEALAAEQVAEAQTLEEDELELGTGRGKQRVDVREIAEKIEARIRREFEDKARIEKIESQLRLLIENGGPNRGQAAPTAAERMAEMRELMSLVKELQPPPAFGSIAPVDPMTALRQSLDMVKTFRSDFGDVLGGPPKGNPALEKLTDALMGLGQAAIAAHQRNTATPAPRPRVMAGGGQQPAGQPATGQGGQGMPTQEQIERDTQLMFNELQHRLMDDQQDQLSPSPITHISETASWIQSRWDDPQAPTVWQNLKPLFKRFSESEIVQFLSMKSPALAVTDAQKAWLTSLVEILKRS